jgi:hypothetical protein
MVNSEKYSFTAKQADEMNRLFELGKYAPNYETVMFRFLKVTKKMFCMDKGNKKRP